MSNRLLGVVVSEISQLTPRIREYLLKSASGDPLPRYEPGAHIELYATSPAIGSFIRHYSLIGGIGSWDDPPNTYRIAVQRESDSRASAFIQDNFALGTQLAVSRPKNSFYLDRSAPKSLLLAGGIGITPIYAMLRSLVRRKKNFELIYSGRTSSGLAYRDDVLRLASHNGRLHVVARQVGAPAAGGHAPVAARRVHGPGGIGGAFGPGDLDAVVGEQRQRVDLVQPFAGTQPLAPPRPG